MDDPQLLLQQLVAQVQALYDSTPGSAPQREADKWLTGLVGLEGAWPVLLRVVGPAAGSGQASPFDVRLTFIAAKIMQLKIQRDWRTCRAEVRQAVQATLVAHLQQQALGGAAAPHDAPIVQNQLVLAFVHLLLQTLAGTRRGGNGDGNGGEFVMEICRLFGITGAPDLGTQLRPLLLLLSILKGLPEEHNRRGGTGGGMDGLGGPHPSQARHHNANQGETDGPVRIPEGDARTVVNLVGSVLAQCDAAEATALAQGGGGGGGGNDIAAGAARRAKLAALQCLQAWAMYVMQAPAWVTLGDMAAWGLLPVLEAQVALAGTARALEPEAFCTVLATITDGLRSMAEEKQHDGGDGGDGGGGYYGPAGAGAGMMNGNRHAGGARDEEERRRRREEVLRSVARVLLGIGRYVVQPSNAYAGDEDVPRSACEGLLTFLERHLEPLWARLGVEGEMGAGGMEAAAGMVRELLQLLLAFTGHAACVGVALPTLELWVYLPEMLGLLHEPTSASPTAAALLGEVQPALVEVLARQCMGSRKWTAEEWRLALGGGGGGRGAARLLQGEEDGGDDDGDEEGFGRLADVLSFRSDAVDAAESMASGWPERHRVGELLYSVMAQRSGDPLAVEAILWLLTGVARGLQRGAELMEDYGDEEEEDYGNEEDEDDGGYYGPASSAAAAAPPSPDRAEGRRARRERQRAFLQPQLWEAVIQGLASLQDPAACVYLWHTAALLLHDLAGLFLAEAPPALIEAASAFLLRALAHPVTCTVAAAALKHVCLRSCDRDRGALGGRGSEPAAAMATAARLGGMITQALQAAGHARGAEGGGAGGAGLLMHRPRAYADLTEALLLLTLRSTPARNVDALVQIVTATIGDAAAGGFPRRADRALVLCAALQALHRGMAPARDGGGALLLDAVVERAWPAVDRSLFGPFDAEAAVSARQRQEKREQRALLLRRGGAGAPYGTQPFAPPPPPQQHPLGRCDELSGAVGACCDVLSALFAAVGPGSKGRLLPLLLGKARALVEYNAGALAAFREATAAQAGAAGGMDTRRAADEAGVQLWPGPLAFLRRVLRALWEEEGEDGGHYGPADAAAAAHGGGGGGVMVQGAQAWWGLLQQAADAGLGLARAALELRVADEDEACGDPGRRQLLVRFYEEAFLLARDVASLGVPSEEAPAPVAALPPPSAVSADSYAVRRGLELVVLALEIPLENSASLKAALSLLEALLRQQAEDALLPLLQGLPPRLVPALLRALVATVNLPSNIRRLIADLLFLLLCNNGGQGGCNNGPLPRASVLSQQALAALLAGGEGSAALHALFAHDPTALAFVGQGLTHLATGQMGRDPLREFVRCFAGLGRREMTVEEAQEDMAAVAAGGHKRRGY